MNVLALKETTPGRGQADDATGTELLRIARASIEHGLAQRRPLPVDGGDLRGVLADTAATFTVTEPRILVQSGTVVEGNGVPAWDRGVKSAGNQIPRKPNNSYRRRILSLPNL